MVFFYSLKKNRNERHYYLSLFLTGVDLAFGNFRLLVQMHPLGGTRTAYAHTHLIHNCVTASCFYG